MEISLRALIFPLRNINSQMSETLEILELQV